MKWVGGSSIIAAVAAVFTVASCGSPSSGSVNPRPEVVVTYSVLGAVVRQVVGGAADVRVLMPGGADPHQWSPSAKDVHAMLGADVLVDNGLGLEGHLQDPLRQARARGVTVFT